MFSFLRKQKAPPQQAPRPTRPRDAVRNPNVVALRAASGSAIQAVPAVKVVTQAADLPDHQGVISGADKTALVRVDASQQTHFCVLRLSERAAALVVGPDFHSAFTREQRMGAGQLVRASLQSHNIELKGDVIRASKEVMAGLLADKNSKVTAAGDAEATAAKGSEGGRLFENWVSYGVAEDASDIHIEIRENVVNQRFRIETELEDMRNPLACFPAQAKNAISVAYNKLMVSNTNSHSNFMSGEYQYVMIPYEQDGKRYRLRVQTLPSANGIDIIMRILKIEGKVYFPLAGDGGQGFELDQAEMMLDAMAAEKGGLIVSSGITGSGKTTAIKSMLDHQPEKERKKRVGVEDPQEYEIDNYTPISIQRDVGDPESGQRAYAKAYASLMRSDLDVGMVGEIRDNVSANAAVVIAETGHLAIGSNHARNLMGIIPRLTSQKIGADLHALTEPGMFLLMTNQALVGKLCTYCRIPLSDPRVTQFQRDQMQRVSDLYRVDVSKVHFRNPHGCPHCRNRGLKGMTVIAEVYAPTDEFLQLMRERKTRAAKHLWLSEWDGRFDSVSMKGKTLFEHALLKMLRGEIDPIAARTRSGGGFEYYLGQFGERGQVWTR